MSHPEVACGQPDHGGLVELRRDGGWKRQQLSQFEELGVLFLATVPRRVLALVLHRCSTEIVFFVFVAAHLGRYIISISKNDLVVMG